MSEGSRKQLRRLLHVNGSLSPRDRGGERQGPQDRGQCPQSRRTNPVSLGSREQGLENVTERLRRSVIEKTKKGGFSRFQQSQLYGPLFQGHQRDPRTVRESPVQEQKPCGFHSAGVELTLTTKEVRNDQH